MYSKIYIALAGVLVFSFYSCNTNTRDSREKENDQYDSPGLAMQYEYERTKDPATGIVPREKLWNIIEYTEQMKQDIRSRFPMAKTTDFGWVERGPNSDLPGPQGNSRGAGSPSTSGRVRAILVDANDATGNTVWAGSVAGGLWKTTNINSTPPVWIKINDKFANLAITDICQNPATPNTLYFCTGEAFFNIDGVRGNGIFKSTDGGVNWTQLSSTTGSGFYYCSRIVCDNTGNVYVGTSDGVAGGINSGSAGLRRSTDGGTSWTTITPSGLASARISDIAISSTGRLHVSSGIFATCEYRYTDNPSTVTSAAGWTSATSGYPSSGKRIELACKGSTLLALPSNNSYQVPTMYQSLDGGATWTALVNSASGFTNGQAWYCLAADINPSNTTQFIVGSLDCYKTTNAGATSWSQISHWASTSPYVHADQHQIIWYNAGAQSRVLVACDGGIFLSTDGGSTFSDKNTGLRIKQFYSCAIHPTSGSNYLLGGAQDNGCHSFSNSGLSNTTEVTGGDGAYVHIDQLTPQNQFGSYVYNDYWRSTNSGSTWTSVTLNSNTGQFINPTDYDNTTKIMYCSDDAGGYRRWTNPTTGNTSAVVAITGFNSANVTAVAVSPYTSNRVYFGTAAGRVIRVDGANTIVSGSAGTNVTGAISAGGTVSCIAFGTTEDTMIVVLSNYGVSNVWFTTNGTSATPTWTAKDGNLPDMPIRWALCYPGKSKKVILATETGIWVTTDISATTPSYLADPFFPNVSTDMLKLRSSDNTVVAATHGRGLWTGKADEIFSVALSLSEFVLSGKINGQDVLLNWVYNTSRSSVQYDVESSMDGSSFNKLATEKSLTGRNVYSYEMPKPDGKVYYRIKSYDAYGYTEYSNTVSFSGNQLLSNTITAVYPNPAKDKLSLNLSAVHDTKVELNVYSLSGAKVLSMPLVSVSKGSQVLNIPVSQLAAGSYILEAVMDDQRTRKQFVKE